MSFRIKVIMAIQLSWMALVLEATGQKADSTFMNPLALNDSISISQLDSIFSYSDSLSIFTMIDSLLNKTVDLGSSLSARVGINSNIVSAGRTIGVSQLGATAGVSYYHKSGLFVDFSSYWSEDYNPNLYLSIATLGYLKMVSKRYSFLASYDRLIYNNTDINVENPLTNMLGLSNFVDFKPVTFRIDYAFYFGEETAQRLTPSVMISLRKYNFLGLDRISFNPSYQVLFGNSTITSIQLAPKTTIRTIRKTTFVQQINTMEFGLMNYALSLPLRISKKNWSLTFAYTYNWPVALKGENAALPENSFSSFTLTKTINFKHR